MINNIYTNSQELSPSAAQLYRSYISEEYVTMSMFPLCNGYVMFHFI